MPREADENGVAMALLDQRGQQLLRLEQLSLVGGHRDGVRWDVRGQGARWRGDADVAKGGRSGVDGEARIY